MTLVKDWMALAAQEIASHFTFGSGRDDYVTDEQRWNIARNFTAIIEKHSPFKSDVAYMPVPRCETCKHWGADITDRQVGECNKSLDVNGKLWADMYDGINTSADFGCVQHEEK